MVVLVCLEVLDQLVDAPGEQCDLHFRRTRVRGVDVVFLYDGRLLTPPECHDYLPFSDTSPVRGVLVPAPTMFDYIIAYLHPRCKRITAKAGSFSSQPRGERAPIEWPSGVSKSLDGKSDTGVGRAQRRPMRLGLLPVNDEPLFDRGHIFKYNRRIMQRTRGALPQGEGPRPPANRFDPLDPMGARVHLHTRPWPPLEADAKDR